MRDRLLGCADRPAFTYSPTRHLRKRLIELINTAVILEGVEDGRFGEVRARPLRPIYVPWTEILVIDPFPWPITLLDYATHDIPNRQLAPSVIASSSASDASSIRP